MTKYTRSRILLLILGVLFCHSTLNAQADMQENEFYQSLNLSYVVGGQVYNDNFVYNPGYSFKASYGKKISSDISVGLGMGYMPLTKGNFLPFYIEILGRKKKKSNTPFINFQGGYSIGWDSSTSSNQHYKINGGIFINAGLGRIIAVNEKYEVLLHWSYCHQFAEIEYEIFGEKNYAETLNYDMLQISIGISFD